MGLARPGPSLGASRSLHCWGGGRSPPEAQADPPRRGDRALQETGPGPTRTRAQATPRGLYRCRRSLAATRQGQDHQESCTPKPGHRTVQGSGRTGEPRKHQAGGSRRRQPAQAECGEIPRGPHKHRGQPPPGGRATAAPGPVRLAERAPCVCTCCLALPPARARSNNTEGRSNTNTTQTLPEKRSRNTSQLTLRGPERHKRQEDFNEPPWADPLHKHRRAVLNQTRHGQSMSTERHVQGRSQQLDAKNSPNLETTETSINGEQVNKLWYISTSYSAIKRNKQLMHSSQSTTPRSLRDTPERANPRGQKSHPRLLRGVGRRGRAAYRGEQGNSWGFCILAVVVVFTQLYKSVKTQ